MKRERPIFVVGHQRSGTTLLQALLGAHPRIASPPETYFIMRISNLREYYGDLRDDTNLRRALHDAIDPPLPLFEGCGFDEDTLFERVAASDRTYRALIDTIMTDFAQRHGKARWCDKTPGQRARRDLQLFPHAQIVHIVRDPREVVASSLATPWTTARAAGIARGWRRFTVDNLAVGAKAGPSRFHQVRYEDLTHRPEEILREICDFLGERFDRRMIADPSRRKATIAATAAPWQSRALETISPAKFGAWKTRLSRVDAARVAAVVHRQIAVLGYERPTASELWLGRAALFADAPREARRFLGRLNRSSHDPEARHREVTRFLQEQANLIAGAARDRS